VASGVNVSQRIIKRIRIPVETLRIGRAGDQRIRLDEAAKRRVVGAGVVKVQADGCVFDLPGEAPRGGRGAVGVARSTPRMIARRRDFATAAARGCRWMSTRQRASLRSGEARRLPNCRRSTRRGCRRCRWSRRSARS